MKNVTPILAIDLGKYKSVACAYAPATATRPAPAVSRPERDIFPWEDEPTALQGHGTGHD